METTNIPKKIFIVPYRNRVEHREFFIRYITNFVLQDIPTTEYEIYFSHQLDSRIFNRGAVKNIGFMAIREKYPNHYKQMTFIFHDIDIMPYDKNVVPYDTKMGEVQHYYGFTHALGGLFAIKGADFERLNGFPTYWGWGLEDNCLQKRCKNLGITINRSHFYKLGNKKILHISDTITKKVADSTGYRFTHDTGVDGLTAIKRVSKKITIFNNIHNKHSNIYMIDITQFDAFTKVADEKIKDTSVAELAKNGVKIKKPINKIMQNIMYNN